MAKPTILAIDDDPQVLSAVGDDLRAKYRRDYRIVVAENGTAGMEAVAELHRRGDDIALFLVDERMPDLSGTEFLAGARDHYPDAKKVLLTAYADTEAAIRSINEIGLDHYLLKPWSPPEDQLYPVLDDLLEEWQAARPAPFDGVRIVGARWSAATHEVKDFLASNRIPYRFLDVDRDDEARTLLAARGDAEPVLPVVYFPDGSAESQPDSRVLAERVGLRSTASAPFYDLVIVGAGPAGLAGAVYGASEGLRVVVLEMKATGGQAGTSSRIENYLGFPNGVSGGELARRATAQATRLGAEILSPLEVATIRADESGRTIVLADEARSELGCHTVLVTSGMKVRHLDVPGYERLHGAGVFYGATLSEAAAYKGERVMVVGGANSAGQAALMFSRFASEVLVLIRGASIGERMSRYLVDQIDATPSIRVLTSTEVTGVIGESHLERVELKHGQSTSTVDAAGLFIFVGAVPHTDFLRGVVSLNEQGFVLTGPDIPADDLKRWPLERDPFLLECNVPGVFAAGDVRHGAVRRVASAVGQGAIAISLVHQYLATA